MCLLGEPVYRPGHAAEKESLCFLLATVPPGRGNQLLRLGHGDRREEIRKRGLQRSAQPDVEEVRQVGIADVVVIRWVGGDDFVARDTLHPSVCLSHMPGSAHCNALERLRDTP